MCSNCRIRQVICQKYNCSEHIIVMIRHPAWYYHEQHYWHLETSHGWYFHEQHYWHHWQCLVVNVVFVQSEPNDIPFSTLIDMPAPPTESYQHTTQLHRWEPICGHYIYILQCIGLYSRLLYLIYFYMTNILFIQRSDLRVWESVCIGPIRD